MRHSIYCMTKYSKTSNETHCPIHPSSFVLQGVIWTGSSLPNHCSLSLFVLHAFLCFVIFWRESLSHNKTWSYHTDNKKYQNLWRNNPVSKMRVKLKTFSISTPDSNPYSRTTEYENNVIFTKLNIMSGAHIRYKRYSDI